MINSLSESVADYFLKNNLIQEYEKEIYIYGIKLIVSSSIGISAILFWGIVLKKFIDSIIFLCIFIILRQYSGGYHANSYLKCNLYFISTFLITEITVIYTRVNYKDFLSIIYLCISFIILLKLSPIDNKNKRLNECKKQKNKNISMLIFLVSILVDALLKITVDNYYYNISVTVFSVTSLMIIQKLKELQNA